MVYAYQKAGKTRLVNEIIDKKQIRYDALIKAGRDDLEDLGIEIAFAEGNIDKVIELLQSKQKRQVDYILEPEYNHEPMYQSIREHPQWDSILTESNVRMSKIHKEYQQLATQDIEALARAHTSRPSTQNVEVKVSIEILEKYVGTYDLTPEDSVKVTLVNDYLILTTNDRTLTINGRTKIKLIPESKTKCFSLSDTSKFSFQKDKKGNVLGMTAETPDWSQRYKKVKK